MSPTRSKRYLAGSRGAACTFRIPGVCTGNRETTVPAHIHDGHAGRGIKASDLSVADACFACHEVFDRRTKLPSGELLSDHDWHVYALRGLQETLEARKALGLLTIPEDRAYFVANAINFHDELVGLIDCLLRNDPNEDAADGVTVLDVWRKDAKALLTRLAGRPE